MGNYKGFISTSRLFLLWVARINFKRLNEHWRLFLIVALLLLFMRHEILLHNLALEAFISATLLSLRSLVQFISSLLQNHRFFSWALSSCPRMLIHKSAAYLCVNCFLVYVNLRVLLSFEFIFRRVDFFCVYHWFSMLLYLFNLNWFFYFDRLFKI